MGDLKHDRLGTDSVADFLEPGGLGRERVVGLGLGLHRLRQHLGQEQSQQLQLLNGLEYPLNSWMSQVAAKETFHTYCHQILGSSIRIVEACTHCALNLVPLEAHLA